MVSSTQTGDAERSTIDPLVQRLLAQTINSPIKLHLVLLFHEHPRLEGSARQIIQRIFRDIWSTQAALRELAEDGILGVIDSASEPVYGYCPATEQRLTIARLVDIFDDPFAREQIHALLHELAGDAVYRRALARGRAEATACACGCPSVFESISSIAGY
jgi:hypothetical protein